MEVSQYLKRIGYEGPLEPTAETLHALQLAHLQTVPFENLSIHANEPIVLNDAALFDKIVVRRRGGFCYELNGLFSWLLRELGFDVIKLSGRVVNSEGEIGAEFDHMTLLVNLEERWLADVGFGDSFVEPLRLDVRTAQKQRGREYLITERDSSFVLSQRVQPGDWKEQYHFSLQTYEYEAFDEMCVYQQTSPQSHFTRKRLCSRLTENGRITITNFRRIVTSADGVQQETVLNDEDYKRALREDFGIALD